MSSTLGSPVYTCWNRRSSAASFSIYFRYSFSVVAPMQCSSPRARAGLSMLEASMAPSAAPAPTKVCSSSMKRTILPSAFTTSLITAFSRSSNSPRYLAPAMSAPISSATRRFSFRLSGTSPEMMRWASPSTIAVLPTPGSPMSTGLFLVRRDRTWMTRRISSSRPITGSSFPRRARSVRSRAYFANAWYLSSGFWSVTFSSPRISRSAVRIASRDTPASARIRPASVPRSPQRARRRCSVETNPSLRASASFCAASKTLFNPCERYTCTVAPLAWGSLFRAASVFPWMNPTFAPIFCSRAGTKPPSCSSSASSRCSGSIAPFPSLPAASWAPAKASWVFMVILSGRTIGFNLLSFRTEKIGMARTGVKAGCQVCCASCSDICPAVQDGDMRKPVPTVGK